MSNFFKELTNEERAVTSAYIEKISSTWAQITDDSMLPMLAPGDVVRTLPLPARESDIVLAEIDGELIVRRLSGDKLAPDNKGYNEIPIALEKILGRVVQIIKSA